jgi:hypothetical protein
MSRSNPRFRAAHAAASYLERQGVAPLSAGGTVYSDEREVLDAERDYWQPRVAVHFGSRLLQWAMFDFGQGIPRVLVVLNPTARRQTLRALDMRARVDREEFLGLPARRRAAQADRALGGRLPRRRADASDASHLLSHRPVRTARPVLKTYPQES